MLIPEKHPYEIIRLNGKDCEIDKEMVPLIKYLDHSGVRTRFCCQGEPISVMSNRAYIVFSPGDHALRFIELVKGFVSSRRLRGIGKGGWDWACKPKEEDEDFEIRCYFNHEDLLKINQGIRKLQEKKDDNRTNV